MQTARAISSCRYLMLLLLLTVLIAGCGGDDADESVPALTIADINPNSTVRSRQLAGTFEPGAVVQVTVDTTAVVNALQVADGHWSCTIEALAPGSNFVTILATDSSGNQNALLLSLLYDPVSIERWVTPIPVNTGTTIGGLIDPAAAGSLTVTVNTAPAGPTPIVLDPVVNGDHWHADHTGLSNGNYLVTVKVTPPAPAVAEVVKTLALNVVAVAPVVTIDQVLSPTNVDNQSVTGTRGNDLAVTVLAPTAVVGDLTPTGNPATWSRPLTELQPGKNPFTASVTLNGVTATARDLIVYDNVPPSIISTVPANAAVNVSSALPVQAVFNESMRETSINNTTFNVACQQILVDGAVTYNAATRTATFTPAAPLPVGACIATLTTAITDLAGNALPGFTWSFTVN